MTSSTESEVLTRDHIMKILSDGEVDSVSSSETQAQLRKGDEYLDLQDLALGVQRAQGAVTLVGHVLPRKAIHEDTWRRILRRLKAGAL